MSTEIAAFLTLSVIPGADNQQMTVRVRVRQVAADSRYFNVEMCRDIDNVSVHDRWPFTTGVAQGRYYCTSNIYIQAMCAPLCGPCLWSLMPLGLTSMSSVNFGISGGISYQISGIHPLHKIWLRTSCVIIYR